MSTTIVRGTVANPGGHFKDIMEWEVFLDTEGYDPSDKQSVSQFSVYNAYGVPQYGRLLHARMYANIYFEKEEDWEALRQIHAHHIIPFMDFLHWTQQRTGWHDDSGLYHAGGRFPLIGPLAGYLLAADMSYAGVVTVPTIQEVGIVIWKNGLGSRGGLITLNQIPGKDAGKEMVVDATMRLYDLLSDVLPQDIRASIGFDAIMLEHALCKYGRCMRDLASSRRQAR